MEINKIYNEDCLETMARMPNRFIDLVVTSPPYDNLRSYNGYSFPFEDIAKELYRITKQGGIVVWIIGDAIINGSETGTSFKQVLYFKEIGFNLHDTMIYERVASYPSNDESVRYSQAFEYMFVLSKGKPKTHNLIRDRQNRWGGLSSFGRQSERLKNGKLKPRKVITVSEIGIRFNIWNYATGKGMSTKDKVAFEHPAIFPEKLARDHIYSWSNEDDLIYDPFIGSGTTAKAALQLNRNYIGSEISQEYCDIAEKRIRIYKSQFKLDLKQ